MARKKVTLAYITNDSTRRATLKKRRQGLLKKARELSVLCNVPVCAVVYSPDTSLPEVWPSPEEAAAVLSQFGEMPELDKTKKMMNQEGFLQQQLHKLSDQLRRLSHENDELAGEVLLRECLSGCRPVESLGSEEVVVLLLLIDRRLKSVEMTMQQMRAHAGGRTRLLLPAPSVPVVGESIDGVAVEGMRGSNSSHDEDARMLDDYSGGQLSSKVSGDDGEGKVDDMLAMLMAEQITAWDGFFPPFSGY
ncbi:hypothetical protein HPP92_019214 [Vanilla planifolia]|uniref:MADS-box domain-containing protein n=1 Tax=Vanilla planifolia TaxID=51239 RepID=A0A835ULI0_VANPL|nr:hypothetical protein HPP92_019214 [Vanilla planifolia]